MKNNILLFLVFSFFIPSSVKADLVWELDRLVGYTIVEKKTIKGYLDKDKKIKEEFNGCEYDRIIVFTDNTVLKCRSYSYSYSYRPDAIILSSGYSIKMVVGNDIYDMSSY